MTDGPVDTPEANERLAQSKKFAKLFGVTESELIKQGIDPTDYAKQHVRSALKNKKNWNIVLPKSSQLAMEWTRLGWRGFIAMFFCLGFLAISKISNFFVLGIVGACIMWIVAGSLTYLTLKKRSEYIRMCRKEGIKPSWRNHNQAH